MNVRQGCCAFCFCHPPHVLLLVAMGYARRQVTVAVLTRRNIALELLSKISEHLLHSEELLPLAIDSALVMFQHLLHLGLNPPSTPNLQVEHCHLMFMSTLHSILGALLISVTEPAKPSLCSIHLLCKLID